MGKQKDILIIEKHVILVECTRTETYIQNFLQYNSNITTIY